MTRPVSNDDIKRSIRAGWDAVSDSYQSETRLSLEDVHYAPFSPGERELGLLGDVRGESVLELACGSAQNSIALAKWGARVTGLDISSRQLNRAKELVAGEGVDVDLVRGDMERLWMFRDGSFDIVLSSFGWEFVPDLPACLEECGRVLRRGGLLVVATVHPLSAFEWDEDEKAVIVTDYFNLPVETWGEDDDDQKPRAVTIFHTIEEMFELLTGAGFSVERLLEPCPYPEEQEARGDAPYSGPYWHGHEERFSRVPFAIVYVARKAS